LTAAIKAILSIVKISSKRVDAEGSSPFSKSQVSWILPSTDQRALDAVSDPSDEARKKDFYFHMEFIYITNKVL